MVSVTLDLIAPAVLATLLGPFLCDVFRAFPVLTSCTRESQTVARGNTEIQVSLPGGTHVFIERLMQDI